MKWYMLWARYIQWRGISRIIQPMAVYMKFLRESMASTSELAHNVSARPSPPSYLIARPSCDWGGAERGFPCSAPASPASRHHLRNRSCSSRLGLSTLPASSLILHLSLAHSLPLPPAPLVALCKPISPSTRGMLISGFPNNR